MTLLLTSLSGALLVLVLVVLILALARILSALEGVRESLYKIAMGVRAIESETAPLGGYIGGVNGTLTELVGGAQAIGERFSSAAGHLGPVAEGLIRIRHNGRSSQ